VRTSLNEYAVHWRLYGNHHFISTDTVTGAPVGPLANRARICPSPVPLRLAQVIAHPSNLAAFGSFSPAGCPTGPVPGPGAPGPDPAGTASEQPTRLPTYRPGGPRVQSRSRLLGLTVTGLTPSPGWGYTSAAAAECANYTS
jgi:hypothetical protein